MRVALRLLNRLEPLLSAAAIALVCCAAVLLAYRTDPVVPLMGAAAIAAAIAGFVRPVWVVYAAILAVPFEAVALPLGPAALTPAESLFALAGGAWALRRIADGRLPAVPTPLTIPLLALVLAVLPGLINAQDDFQVLKRFAMWGLFFLTFNMLVAEGSRATVRNMLVALAAAGGIEGLIVVFSAVGGGPVDRFQGTFEHANTLGLFVAMALPAAIAVALGRSGALRAPAIAAAAAMVAALVFSLSRGAVLGAVGGLVVFLAVRSFRRLLVATVAVGLVVSLLILGGAIAPPQGIPQVTALEERLTGAGPGADRPDDRIRIWDNTPRLIADHLWFGVGSYNFKEFSVRYGIVKAETRQPYTHAHNVPLTVLAEMGLVGLAAFVWVLVGIARVLLRACSRRAGRDRVWAIAIAGTVTAVGLQGLVDDTIGANGFVALTLSLVAGATVIALSVERAPVSERLA